MWHQNQICGWCGIKLSTPDDTDGRLVVEPYPSEKYASVSWDDDIPNMMESHKIPWFQTTNQMVMMIAPAVCCNSNINHHGDTQSCSAPSGYLPDIHPACMRDRKPCLGFRS